MAIALVMIVAPVMFGIATPAGAAPDWSVAITTQPPSSANVGDTVSAVLTITNNPGIDTVGDFSIVLNAASAGKYDSLFVNHGLEVPQVPAGTTVQVDITARLLGVPGTANTLAVDVTAASAGETKTGSSNPVASVEAVSASLTAGDDSAPSFAGDAATVTPANQIQYVVTFVNDSDTAATLSSVSVPVPTGTTTVSSSPGALALAAGSTSTFTLVVAVNDDITNGATIIETPSASYSMSDISLANRAVAVAPASYTSTVEGGAPPNTAPTATNDAYSLKKNQSLIVPAGSGVLTNDSDIDGDTLAAELLGTTTNGTLTLNANGSFSYRPSKKFTGVDTFTYSATDGTASSAAATVTLTVKAGK